MFFHSQGCKTEFTNSTDLISITPLPHWHTAPHSSRLTHSVPSSPISWRKQFSLFLILGIRTSAHWSSTVHCFQTDKRRGWVIVFISLARGLKFGGYSIVIDCTWRWSAGSTVEPHSVFSFSFLSLRLSHLSTRREFLGFVKQSPKLRRASVASRLQLKCSAPSPGSNLILCANTIT